MTDELLRLAHRVIMPGFAGTTLPAWARRAGGQGLGGVCLFGHNVASTAQLRALTDEVHAAGPTLVSIDEEGGIVSRLGAIAGSPHVGAAALGMADDLSLTRGVAAAIGHDLHEAGVDLDLAPVADVSSNPDNPVIGVRAFGTDPDRVGQHVRAAIEGLGSANVLACAKHFPGHGDTTVDSHVGLPRIGVNLGTLTDRDLVPFRAAIEAGVAAVMTAHIIFPALDDQPATLSAPVLRLLRDDLGFTGLITSDAMDMRAIADTIGVAEGCVQALIAGVDLVGLGNPVLGSADGDEAIFREVIEAVLSATRDGRLPLHRLREAAARVDAITETAATLRAQPAPVASAVADATAATASLRSTGELAGSLAAPITIVDVRRHRNVASGRPSGLIAQELLARAHGSRLAVAFEAHGVVDGHAAADVQAHRLPETAEVILTGSPWLDAEEQAALQSMLSRSPEAIVICTGWAPDATRLTPATRTVRTFGDSIPTARAVADLLLAD